MKTMRLRIGILAMVLALAPTATALANGRDNRGRSGHDNGDRNGGSNHDNDDHGRQVVCWQGGTYTVERAAVPLILIYGGRLGACPASPSR